jgi:hypothetical protein
MDSAGYESQRRNISDQYTRDSAANQFGRFVSQQRSNRNLGDYQRNFARSYPKFNAQWGTRGMTGGGVRSGAFKGAMQQYVGDYSRGLGHMQQDQANDMQGFDMQQANMEAARQRALADLQMQQQREIAEAAVNIMALRPYVGG